LPALTQSQMQALPDVLASDRFIINFGSIPGKFLVTAMSALKSRLVTLLDRFVVRRTIHELLLARLLKLLILLL
jgi:hypothetical protein